MWEYCLPQGGLVDLVESNMILYADKTLGAGLEFHAITLGLVLHFEIEILRIIAIHTKNFWFYP